MNNPLLPWILLGSLLLSVLSGAAGYWRGGVHKADEIEAQIGRDAATAARVEEAAQTGAAKAISEIEVKNVTIRQRAETITREVPVYGNCHHSPDGLRSVNEALTGQDQPPSDSKLPATGPSD